LYNNLTRPSFPSTSQKPFSEKQKKTPVNPPQSSDQSMNIEDPNQTIQGENIPQGGGPHV